MSVWTRRADVLWRTTADRVLLLAPEADEVVTVSGPGVAVWLLLDQPQGFDDLVVHLSDLYGAEQARVAEDLDPLLADLADRRLVEEVSQP